MPFYSSWSVIMNQSIDVKVAIANLQQAIREADRSFDDYIQGDVWSDSDWKIETCFLGLLLIVEALGFNNLYQMINDEYSSIKSSEKGFMKSEITPDGELYSSCLATLR